MFREIRKSEKITELSAKDKRIKYLWRQLFDLPLGSERWVAIKAEIDALENGEVEVVNYDPNKLVLPAGMRI